MKVMQRTYLLLLLALVLAGCGTKDPEQIAVNLNFSGTNPFTNPNLSDIVFTLTDTGNPSAPLVFPSACANQAALFAPRCGFPPDETEFKLDPTPIAKEAQMTIAVQGRDANATVLFSGTSAVFANNPASSPVAITVTP